MKKDIFKIGGKYKCTFSDGEKIVIEVIDFVKRDGENLCQYKTIERDNQKNFEIDKYAETLEIKAYFNMDGNFFETVEEYKE